MEGPNNFMERGRDGKEIGGGVSAGRQAGAAPGVILSLSCRFFIKVVESLADWKDWAAGALKMEPVCHRHYG